MESLDELIENIREKRRKEEQMTIEQHLEALREEYIEKPRRERQKGLRELGINISRDE